MEKIFLYNTLTRQKEEFKSIKKNLVTMYHCGPTVYWTQHIGNLRGMFCSDLITKTFKYNNYKIKLVRNYTDVGHLTSDRDEGVDKMEKASKRENKNPIEIANKYIKIFERDIKELNIDNATYKPRATKYIKQMIKMVSILLKNGYAYSTDLAIYFDVSKAKNYNQLSKQKIEENISGVGKGDVEDKNKKNPNDFALWFFKAGKHVNALQYWKSPFKSNLVKNGYGFPGWHIECSTMSKELLGKTIDIHMGGIEHIPVHHTNEIAQSESANGVKFVNYWLHNEHLLVNNEKMSKSTGTTYSLGEIKQKGFNPLILRYFFLQAHYRSKQNFTFESLKSAEIGLNNIYNQIQSLGKKIGKINNDFKKKFIKSLNDDFNSSKALAVLQETLKSNLNNSDKLATILDFDKVLGLNFKNIKLEKIEIPENIKLLAEKRLQVRQEKNWNESDKLRDEINKLGFEIEDTKDGYNLKKK
ncbi:MAG TPA: cysteine--tRNA ligase [bacterium]|nr:cysteine--tRNA ligase [bacterium]